MAPDLQSQILYILLPFEQDAKLSWKMARYSHHSLRLNKSAFNMRIVQYPDVIISSAKGSYLTTGSIRDSAKVTGPYRTE